MFIRNNKGQPILEYVVLIAVIIAAVLIMQIFIRRGYSGRLKSAADDMGEQFSASHTTSAQSSIMAGQQTVTSEVATTAIIQEFVDDESKTIVDKGVYSLTERVGGNTTITEQVRTDAAKKEAVRWSDLPDGEAVENFAFPVNSD